MKSPVTAMLLGLAAAVVGGAITGISREMTRPWAWELHRHWADRRGSPRAPRSGHEAPEPE